MSWYTKPMDEAEAKYDNQSETSIFRNHPRHFSLNDHFTSEMTHLVQIIAVIVHVIFIIVHVFDQ